MRKPTTAEEQSLAEQVKKKRQDAKAYPLMSVDEAMLVFMKSRPTIYRWLQEGKLASSKIRGRILTRSVLALLQKRPPTSK